MEPTKRMRWIASVCDGPEFSERMRMVGNDERAVYFENDTIIEERTALLRNGCALYVGAHTCVLGSGVIAPFVTIGRYSSISFRVSLGSGARHPDFLSTGVLPGQDVDALALDDMKAACDAGDSRGFTRIGCDVWIGANAVVQQGCAIGHGACVGAGAVVVEDVPPYAIVVGNPARITRYRFAEPIIDSLLRTRWWTLPQGMIKNLPFKDITLCADVLEEIRYG